MLYYILTIVGGLFMSFIISVMVTAPGRDLGRKFKQLGVLKGKTYQEIVKVVRVENSRSAMNDGVLRQWMQTGYHISLLFDKNDICLGVSSETRIDP